MVFNRNQTDSWVISARGDKETLDCGSRDKNAKRSIGSLRRNMGSFSCSTGKAEALTWVYSNSKLSSLMRKKLAMMQEEGAITEAMTTGGLSRVQVGAHLDKWRV